MTELITYFYAPSGVETKDLIQSSTWVKYTRQILLTIISLSPDVTGLIAEYVSTILHEDLSAILHKDLFNAWSDNYTVELPGYIFYVKKYNGMDDYRIEFQHRCFDWDVVENPKLYAIQDNGHVIEIDGVKCRYFNNYRVERIIAL